MSEAEALQVFGNTINATYAQYQGGDTDIVFTYAGLSQAAAYTLVCDTQTEFDPSSWSWLVYSSPALSPDPNPQRIQFDIRPLYSIFDTSQIHTAISFSTGRSFGGVHSPSADTFNSPQWKWNISGSDTVFENSLEDGDGHFAYFYGYTFSGTANPFYYNYVPMDFSAQNNVSAYSYRAVFSGQYDDGYYYLMLACPYIDNSGSGESGIVTTVSGQAIANIETGINNINSGINELNTQMNELNTGISGLVSGQQQEIDILSDIIQNITIPNVSAPASLYLDPVGTLPDPNYDQIIDAADDVLDDLPPALVGVASLWAVVDSVLGVDSAFLWLIPLCIFLCVCSWVVWRR